MIRPLLIASFLLVLASGAQGQGTGPQQGKSFSRPVKNAYGDLYTVVDGLINAPDGPLMYVEEGLVHKVVRLDKDLVPAGEVVLKDLSYEGAKWNGTAPVIVDGTLHCLLIASGKKATEFALVTVTPGATPSIGNFRRLATFEGAPLPDAASTLARRPLPDPILFTRGLAFAQQERIIRSSDGAHYLLNLPSHHGKGAKRFWFACLDSRFNVLWSGVKDLPYEDLKSSVQQIALAADGTIHLLSYVFTCKSEEQRSDKLCHELHLTSITAKGDTVRDLLLDKEFISSARMTTRSGGEVTLAIRYGALTGKPGLLMTLNTRDPKLKPTPVVTQRLPSIRKTKLTTFGVPGATDKGASASRASAKVPDEVVDLIPAWNGGHVLVEMYLDNAFQLPMGDAIAMRRISGAVRATYFDAKDTLRWQHVADRAFMTTAGQGYETVNITVNENDLLLLYDHTPRGMEGILRLGQPAVDGKGGKDGGTPIEPGVVRSTLIGSDGQVLLENTVLMPANGDLPCPMGTITDRNGRRVLLKTFDRNTSYSFVLFDPTTAAP